MSPGTRTKRIAAAAMVVGGLVLSAGPAFAQAQGRVMRDPAIVLRPDGAAVAAVVTAGTILDVTAQSDHWYEVVVPGAVAGQGERGVIQRSLLQLLSGSAELPEKPLRGDIVPARPRLPEQSSAPPAHVKAEAPRRPVFHGGFRRFLSVNGAYQSTSKGFGANMAPKTERVRSNESSPTPSKLHASPS